MADQNPNPGQSQGQDQQNPNQDPNQNPNQNPNQTPGQQRQTNIPGERPSEAHDENWRKKDQGQGGAIEEEQKDRQNPSGTRPGTDA